MTDAAIPAAAAEPAVSPEPAAEPSVEPVVEPAPEPASEPPSEPTARDAIDRAFDAVDKMGAAEEPADPAPEEGDKAKDLPERGPDGKFKAKEGDTKPEEGKEPAKPETPFSEAPSRFSADAKEAWKNAPDPVKAEIHRAIKEMETGLNQYREVVEPLKPYIDLAQQHNTSIEKALGNYIALERELGQNPMRGMESVLQYIGMTPQQYVEKVTGQAPEQAQARSEQTIMELRQEIAGLKDQLGGVSESIKSQNSQQAQREIEAFSTTHPRTEELAQDIAIFLNSGRAQNLQEAYELAERLNPVAQPAPAPAAPAAPPADPAHTRKGQLSVTGAPSSGSDPANRKPPSSAREALDRSFASLGLG